MAETPIITGKIREYLKKENISQSEFGRRIKLSSGAISSMLSGEAPFPDDKIPKIARILRVSGNEVRAWVLADKYSQETIKRALELQKEHAKSREKVVTIKMHELMREHNLNVCAFAKVLDYNQGWLSQVILGNESVSKKLMPKLTAFSGLSEDEIKSWLVADRYPPEILRLAVG